MGAMGSGSRCVECSAGGVVEAFTNPVLLVTIGIGVVVAAVGIPAFIIFVICKSKKLSIDSVLESAKSATDGVSALWDRFMSKIKVAIAFFQIAGTFRISFNITYPAVYTKFLSSLSGVVDINLPDIMGVRCVVDYNYIASIVMQTVWPIAVEVVLGCTVVILFIIGRKMKAAQRVAGWGVSAMLTISFLVYPSVSVALFRYFKCVPVGGGKSDVLLADMNIECESAEYLGFIAYVVVMIGIYPIGIPATYFLLLLLKRKDIMEREDENLDAVDFQERMKRIAPLSFLWSSYEPKFWWWEVLEMMRKLVLAGFLVIFLEGSMMQLSTAMIVTLVAVGAYCLCTPYDASTDDVAQIFAQFQLFITLLSGMLLKMDRSIVASSTSATTGSTEESAALGVLLILCNLSVIGIGFLATCKDVWDAFGVGNLLSKNKSGVPKSAKVSPNEMMGALSKGVNE